MLFFQRDVLDCGSKSVSPLALARFACSLPMLREVVAGQGKPQVCVWLRLPLFLTNSG